MWIWIFQFRGWRGSTYHHLGGPTIKLKVYLFCLYFCFRSNKVATERLDRIQVFDLILYTIIHFINFEDEISYNQIEWSKAIFLCYQLGFPSDGPIAYASLIALWLSHISYVFDFWTSPSSVRTHQNQTTSLVYSLATLYFASHEKRERVINFLLHHETRLELRLKM